ncbi:MAG: DinB family protein [Planctomycetaceae bacterium]|nr:DinB family protein [Planctomycetaceae bacterium]
MEPLKIYDYLTLARQRIFEWVRPLSAEQYGREFPIGLGTLGRTLTHIMICEWAYVQRIQGRDLPPYETWPIQDEKPPPFTTLEPVWITQAGQTRAALAAVRDWSKELEYRVTRNDRTSIITASPADIFTQMALHEVHHRAQAMNMLRHLGVAAEDIDFNTLMYQRRDAQPSSQD